MALQAVGTIWIYRKRVCVVEGHGTKRVPKKPGWTRDLVWNYHQVRFLDGQTPTSQDVAEKEFTLRGKPLKGGTLPYWQRVYQLKQQGLMIQDAVRQANAELAKGIGTDDVMTA